MCVCVCVCVCVLLFYCIRTIWACRADHLKRPILWMWVWVWVYIDRCYRLIELCRLIRVRLKVIALLFISTNEALRSRFAGFWCYALVRLCRVLPQCCRRCFQKGGNAEAVDYHGAVNTAKACIELGVPRLIVISRWADQGSRSFIGWRYTTHRHMAKATTAWAWRGVLQPASHGIFDF